MKALITGASGFIGKSLTKKLLTAGFSVRLLTRNISRLRYISNKVEIIEGNLTSCNFDFYSLVSGCDLIFHCAAEISDTSKMKSLHVIATKKLLKTLIEIAKIEKRKKHFIQLSSIGVYGSFSKQSNINEESKIKPKNEYERTKAISDKVLIKLLSKTNVSYSILRPSIIVGDNMKNQSFFALINAIKLRKFFFIGNRDSIAHYIHVDDVVDALFLCAISPGAKNQVFNLSNDCKFSDIVDAIAFANNIEKAFYCIPESFVRAVSLIMSIFKMGILTKSRINSLTSSTSYSSMKAKNYLCFSPSRSIPQYASQYSKKAQ